MWSLSVALVFVFALFGLITFAIARAGLKWRSQSTEAKIFVRYHVISLILIFTATILFKVTRVKDIYLYPIYCISPILFFGAVSLSTAASQRIAKASLYVVAVAMVALCYRAIHRMM